MRDSLRALTLPELNIQRAELGAAVVDSISFWVFVEMTRLARNALRLPGEMKRARISPLMKLMRQVTRPSDRR